MRRVSPYVRVDTGPPTSGGVPSGRGRVRCPAGRATHTCLLPTLPPRPPSRFPGARRTPHQLREGACGVRRGPGTLTELTLSNLAASGKRALTEPSARAFPESEQALFSDRRWPQGHKLLAGSSDCSEHRVRRGTRARLSHKRLWLQVVLRAHLGFFDRSPNVARTDTHVGQGHTDHGRANPSQKISGSFRLVKSCCKALPHDQNDIDGGCQRLGVVET